MRFLCFNHLEFVWGRKIKSDLSLFPVCPWLQRPQLLAILNKRYPGPLSLLREIDSSDEPLWGLTLPIDLNFRILNLHGLRSHLGAK